MMFLLLLAALTWVLWHVGAAGTRLRDRIVARIGEQGFMILFSVVSLVLIVLMINAYKASPEVQLWIAPDWLLWLLVLAMLPASILFIGSVTVRNPTMAGPPSAELPTPRGILRITRHPMLNAFSIWAVVHILGNGDVASLLFFGGFLVTSVAGMPSIDAKLLRRNPARWTPFLNATSKLPFAAIVQGRSQLDPAEIGWLTPALGIALWLALIALHPYVIGISPLPA